MNEDKRDDASYFGSVAEGYERLQPILAGPGYTAGLGLVVELLPREPSDAFRFVELGCGTAALSDRLLEQFPRSTGVAIDSEQAMLTVARGRLEERGERAELREADFRTCELPPCDVVLSSYAFHHVAPEDMHGLLGRVAAVLAPNGCFILLDQMKARTPWGRRLGAQGRRIHERHVAAAVAGGRVTPEEVEARREFKRRMKAEGKDVEYVHVAEDVLDEMLRVGFDEAGLVWRMFAATLLVAFTLVA